MLKAYFKSVIAGLRSMWHDACGHLPRDLVKYPRPKTADERVMDRIRGQYFSEHPVAEEILRRRFAHAYNMHPEWVEDMDREAFINLYRETITADPGPFTRLLTGPDTDRDNRTSSTSTEQGMRVGHEVTLSAGGVIPSTAQIQRAMAERMAQRVDEEMRVSIEGEASAPTTLNVRTLSEAVNALREFTRSAGMSAQEFDRAATQMARSINAAIDDPSTMTEPTESLVRREFINTQASMAAQIPFPDIPHRPVTHEDVERARNKRIAAEQEEKSSKLLVKKGHTHSLNRWKHNRRTKK